MLRKRLLAVLICSVAAFVLSCGHGQILESITVQPSGVIFGSPSAAGGAQLTALGTYAYPTATKDITSQVTWKSDIPAVAVVSSTGMVTTSGTGACGVTNISATLESNGNTIVGYSTATVDNANITNCPQVPP